MTSPTTRKGKEQAGAVTASQRRAMLHAPGILGNMHGTQRPVLVPPEKAAVRACVSSWAGRTLRVQETGELRRAEAVLAAHESKLADLNPNAPRLLYNLRVELAKPERQQAA